MQKLAVKVLAVLMASSVCVSNAGLPKANPKVNNDTPISVSQYTAEHEIHLFYSDKTYCYIWGYHGFAMAGGKWHYQNPTTIKVKTHPAGNDYFGYWDYTEKPELDQKILISSLIVGKHGKLLLGFGNENPENMAWYDPEKDDMAQAIPQNATYVFLGNSDKNSLGEYQLKRFALTPKPSEKGKYFNYILAKDFEGMPEDALKEFKPSYKVKNKQIVFHGFERQTLLDSKTVQQFKLNSDEEQANLAKNAYDYCKTGHGMAYFRPDYKQAEYLKPTVIQWKGTPLEDNWQKAKNDEF